jgi:hypothetical protein
MATSGSTNHSTDRDNLIHDALIECHVIAVDETIANTDSKYVHANRVLNDMIKHWQVQGYNLFRRSRDTLTLVAAQGTDANPYQFGTGGDKTYRPLRIENMRYLDSSGNERPMTAISRDEYDRLPDKDSTGETTLFCYDPQRDPAKLYIWPVLKSGGSGTLVYTYQRSIEDFDADADEPDYPQEWFETLKYGLAARLAPVYYPADALMMQRLQAVAGQKLEESAAFDKEPVSTTFMVDWRR